jgi:hypothetical protein
MLSTQFPVYHSKKGQATNFIKKMLEGDKIHTIRQNYDRWKQRAHKINAGQAILSIRIWDGRPYHSTMTEVFKCRKITVEPMQTDTSKTFIEAIARNDGLTVEDFHEWFKRSPKTLQAIIYFKELVYTFYTNTNGQKSLHGHVH